MKEIITDSIRYWEPRRIIFNVALGGVAAASFFCCQPFQSSLAWLPAIGLLVAAVVANVLYCTAYLADIFFQISEYRQTWRQYRWALLVIGTAFAAGLFLLGE